MHRIFAIKLHVNHYKPKEIDIKERCNYGFIKEGEVSDIGKTEYELYELSDEIFACW